MSSNDNSSPDMEEMGEGNESEHEEQREDEKVPSVDQMVRVANLSRSIDDATESPEEHTTFTAVNQPTSSANPASPRSPTTREARPHPQPAPHTNTVPTHPAATNRVGGRRERRRSYGNRDRYYEQYSPPRQKRGRDYENRYNYPPPSPCRYCGANHWKKFCPYNPMNAVAPTPSPHYLKRQRYERYERPSRPRRDDACYRCGHAGHFARNCPDAQPRSSPRTTAPVVSPQTLSPQHQPPYPNNPVPAPAPQWQLQPQPTLTWQGGAQPTATAMQASVSQQQPQLDAATVMFMMNKMMSYQRPGQTPQPPSQVTALAVPSFANVKTADQ